MPTPIAGNIQSKSADGKRIKLDDGNWYGAFAAASLNHVGVGDHVTFNYDLSTKTDMSGNPYRNIKSAVSKAGASSSAPTVSTSVSNTSNAQIKVGEPILSNSRCIIRQNALTNSVNYHTALMEFCMDAEMREEAKKHPSRIVESILKAAAMFEAYTSGDDDEAEAKKELGEE